MRLLIGSLLTVMLSIPLIGQAEDIWGMDVQDNYEFCGVRKKFGLSWYVATIYDSGAEFHMNVYRKTPKSKIQNALETALENCDECTQQEKDDFISIIPTVNFKDRVIFTDEKVSLLENGTTTELGATTPAIFETLRDYIKDLTASNSCP